MDRDQTSFRESATLDAVQGLAGKLPMILVLVTLAGCASSSDSVDTPAACLYGPQCEESDPEKAVIASGATPPEQDAGPAAASGFQPNPLCGGADAACSPDVPDSCDSAPVTDLSGSAGHAGASGESDAGRETSSFSLRMGCRVRLSEDGQRQVAVCGEAGFGETADPCVSSADCSPGYACVGSTDFAQCRPFCCNDPESCESGTYCAERVLRMDQQAGLSALKVPVCVAPAPCRLDEPFPCLGEESCVCKPGTACMVVRADGTTDCVPPGSGSAGDSCPCAAGHVCSLGTNECRKICKINSLSEPQCSEGECQSSSNLPEGYGTCVLDNPDAG